MNVECSNQRRIRLVYISLCSASQETTKSTSNLPMCNTGNGSIMPKSQFKRWPGDVRFLGIGWRVEISEKNHLIGRSHSTFI